MSEKQSKNENREKLTVLIDKDIKLKIKKEVLDLDCSIGEFIEKLYNDYKKI
ncbi:hypothetical protein [Clostridium tagluense]|uniref:hypothetical protein n=1 Tax=Clostridium tagluense TaxID=360422 RepID=UPI001C6E3C5E|nr:hypothetical protein [Clostridium tagluense]MBW9157222.1 hypothetical protein [Clostridium tagluense]WLC67177.1 hypothetical protein KTC93_08365 [Clostridium tagluense]